MRVAVMACEPYSVCQQQHIIMGLPIGQNERRFSCRDEQMQNIFRLKSSTGTDDGGDALVHTRKAQFQAASVDTLGFVAVPGPRPKAQAR